jgi:5-methylcytosine-specific restriction protein A
MYQIDKVYTREDIQDILEVPHAQRGGDWRNGYHRHENDYYIFCNVGTAGRTGHDYSNQWNGETLEWEGKTQSHFRQQAIKNMLSDDYRCLIFWREQDRAAFKYAGVGSPHPHFDTERPVRIDWSFTGENTEIVHPDEVSSKTKHIEGSVKQVLVNRYERDPVARQKCIEHFGATCQVCAFDFSVIYGDLGEGFIHVHHLKQLSDIGEEYDVDPIKDLIPVCPNCHAMLHKQRPPYSPNELLNLMPCAQK